MTNLCSITSGIKWAIIAPLSDKGFPKSYQSALRKAGFSEIGLRGVYATFYNSNNESSVNRIMQSLTKLNDKIKTYKRKHALLSFTITDKQFGLTQEQARKLVTKKGWMSYPCANGEIIAITYNQMYAEGRIELVGSQGGGVRFDGNKAKSKVF